MRPGWWLLVVLAACGTQVDATNPYDPQSPTTVQAKAHFEGHALLEGQTAHDGTQVKVTQAAVATPLTYTTETQADGGFALEAPAGTYDVLVTHAGFQKISILALSVLPGEQRSLGALAMLVARGAAQGKIVLDDGGAPAGTTITLIPQDKPGAASSSVVAGPDGSWFAAGLPVGAYVARAEKPGYAPSYTPPPGPAHPQAGPDDAGSGDSGLTLGENATATAPTLRLYPASAIVQAKVGSTLDAPFTATRGIDVQLLAFVQFLSDMRLSEDPAFADTEYVQFAAQVPFTLADADGVHTLYAQFRDAYGQESGLFQTTIILDRAQPQITALTINGGAAFLTTPGATADIAFSAQDLLSGVGAYRLTTAAAFSDEPFLPLDSVGPSVSFTQSLGLGDSDGPRQILLQARDRAGNISQIASASIFRDKTPPALGTPALKIDPAQIASDGSVGSLDVTLIFDVTSDRAGERLFMAVANAPGLDGHSAFVPFESPHSHRLAPGPDALQRQVCAIFRDEAGLLTGQQCIDVKLDTTPPQNPQVVIEESDSRPYNGFTSQRAVTLHLSASQGAVGAIVSENPALTDGAPVAMQDAATVQFTLGGAGLRTVWARFFDAAGNASDLAAASVTVDEAAPAAAQPTLTPSGFTRSTAITLTPPAGGQDEVSLTGDVVAPAGFVAAPAGVPIAVTLTSGDGPKTLNVLWRDLADNTTALDPIAITLDTAAPQGCALTLTGRKADGSEAPTGKTASPHVTASIDGCDETPTDLFLSTTAVSCGASLAWSAFQAQSLFTLTGVDGLNTVHGCVRDAAGNISAVAAGSITLDTQGPTAAQVSIDSGALYVNATQVSSRGGYVASIAGSASGAVAWAIGEGDAFGDFAPLGGAVNFAFAGDGPRTIHAVFADEVGNLSAVASASITFDTQPPDTSTASIQFVTNAPVSGYTASVSTVVAVTAPADAAQMVLAPAHDANGCAGSDFAGRLPQPASASASFLLPPGDGNKRVCARFLDAAGNVSNIVSDTVVLDTVVPTAPLITTPASIVGIAQGCGTRPLAQCASEGISYEVDLFGPVTDANFYRYERLGGRDNGWTADAQDPATTAFQFTLAASPTHQAESGIQNLLKLRAVDKAGNIGPEAFVVITTDIKAPEPVVIDRLWVNNANGKATFYWQNTASPDVVAYKVHYGHRRPSPYDTPFGGVYAANGISPVTIGNASSYTLTGLTNGEVSFVSVTAIDRAGNEGSFPTHLENSQGGATPVPDSFMLQAQQAAVNPVADVSLPFTPTRLAREGNYLYAFGPAPSPNMTLQAIDLGSYASPVEYGTIDTSVPVPIAGAPIVLPGDFLTVSGNPWGGDCQYEGDTNNSGGCEPTGDLLGDGHFLYVASGKFLRIFNLDQPLAPTLIDEIDLTPLGITRAGGLSLRGEALFVSDLRNTRTLAALSMHKLYDTDPSLPGVSDVIALVSQSDNGFRPTSTLLTRNELIWFGAGQDYPFGGAAQRFVGDTLTSQGALGFFGHNRYPRNFAYGRYLYDFNGGLEVLDARPLWTNQAFSSLSAQVAILNNDGYGDGEGFGQGDFLGNEAWYPVLDQTFGDGVRGVELNRIGHDPANGNLLTPQIVDRGIYRAYTGTTNAVLIYGTDLLMAVPSGVHIARTVSPRSMAIDDQFVQGGSFGARQGHRVTLAPGMAYVTSVQLPSDYGPSYNGSGGFDLMLGSLSQSGMGDACADDLAVLGETTVTAGGGVLRIANEEDAIDRDPSTPFDWTDTNDHNDFTLPNGAYASSVAAVGSQLVVLESRADGWYLEVFNASRLRSHQPPLTLTQTDSRGDYKISSSLCDTTCLQRFSRYQRVTMSGGRAVVTIDGVGLRIIDLRPLLDEDPATVMTAANDQGTVDLGGSIDNGGRDFFDLAVRGNYLIGTAANCIPYFNGLLVVNIAEGLDDDPSTIVPANAQRKCVVASDGTDGFFATGSYAFMTTASNNPYQSTNILALDISRPLQPQQLAALPFKATGVGNCTRASIAVAGRRAYMLQSPGFYVLGLQ